MTEFSYLTPCLELSVACNPDWAGVAALGGLAAALVTLVAVVVALRTASAQRRAADDAVAAERAKAEYIQEREWKKRADEHRKVAEQLAHAISGELAYARRHLVPLLNYWSPFSAGNVSDEQIESYANPKPLNDLVLLRSCIDRLQGFDDEDAIALLTVLTTWQFFNGPPGTSALKSKARASADWKSASRPRVEFGLELLDMIESAIDKMQRYQYRADPAGRTKLGNLPDSIETKLKNLRVQMREG